MSSKYYNEFDFYRRLLRIIETDSNSDYKVRAIKCAIMDQFNNYSKYVKNSRGFGHFDDKGYFYYE